MRNIFFALFITTISTLAFGANLVVTNTADSGAGSLRNAISTAAPADVITFNLSGCPCTIGLGGGTITIDKDLYIVGPGANLLTIQRTSPVLGMKRLFFINGGTVYLSGMRLFQGLNVGGSGQAGGGGGGGGLGGGVFVNFGTLVVENVIFEANTAKGGGGGLGGGAGGGGGQSEVPTGHNGENGGIFGGIGGLGATTCASPNGAPGGEGAGGGGSMNTCSGCQFGGAGGFAGGGGGGGAGVGCMINTRVGGTGGVGGGGGGGTGNSLGFGGGGGSFSSSEHMPGGGGGAGLGGAVFVRSGILSLAGPTLFTGNTASGGLFGNGTPTGTSGQGKGGAIFLMSGTSGVYSTPPTYSGNSAQTDFGTAEDNDDIFGSLSACPAISAAISGGGPACGTGAVNVQVSGGTAPYRLALAPNSGTQTGAGPNFSFTMPPGTYNSGILVMDANGCAGTFSGNATLTQIDPAMTVTDSIDPVPLGQNVTLTVTLSNNTGVSCNHSVTTTIPSNFSVVSATPSQGSCSGTSTLTCNLGDLSNGSSAVISILANAVTVGTPITTATLGSGGPSANQQTTIIPSADLGVIKTADPSYALFGEDLTYTLQATNNGPSAATNVIVTDNLPSEFSVTTATVDDDNTPGEFGGGTQQLTQWDAANSWLELNSPGSAWQLPDAPGGWFDVTGLRAMLHMNDLSGNIANTAPGNPNNGLYLGSTSYNLPGKISTSIGFNGTDSAVLVPAYMPLFSKITMMAWIKPQGTSIHPIIEFHESSSIGTHLWQYSDASTLYANFVDSSFNSHPLVSPTGSLVPGKWQHVAATYNNATGVGSLYINGELAASANLGSFLLKTDYHMYIGQRPPAQNHFNGSIDEVAVFDRDLSTSEISRIYRHQVGFSGTFDSVIHDAGAGRQWSALQWVPQRPLYKALPNNAQTESGYLAGNANMSGDALLFHLNETAGATTFPDSSGQSNPGTCAGISCPTTDEGLFGNAMRFDGVDDQIQISTFNGIPLGNSSYTIEAWINPATINQNGGIIGWGNYGSDRNVNALRMFTGCPTGSAGLINYWWVADLGVCTPELGPHKWNHVAVSYDSNTSVRSLYVNGTLAASDTISNHQAASSDFVIGRTCPDSVCGNEHFTGMIDEVAVYNRALLPSELADHYLRGATRLKYQVRSCDDPACAGEAYAGPDGMTNTYFSELTNTTTGLPPASGLNPPQQRYAQYRAFFESEDAAFSPELKSVTLRKYAFTTTQGTCSLLGSLFSCNLGTLNSGGGATVSITGTPSADGLISNTGTISSTTYDDAVTNNSSTVSARYLDPALNADGDPLNNGNDCRPVDPNVWAIPSPALGLTLSGSGATNLTWSPPSQMGSASVLYDLLRSNFANDFSSAVCLESDDTNTSAQDPAAPSGALYYLIRVENVCGSNMGASSTGVPHTGPSCP